MGQPLSKQLYMEGKVEEYDIYLLHIGSYVKSMKGEFENMTFITNDILLR